MTAALGPNLLAWMAQTILLAAAGAVLPLLLRGWLPRGRLVYCHIVLGLCLLLPAMEPWSHPRLSVPAARLTQIAPASVPGPAGAPASSDAEPAPSTQKAAPVAPTAHPPTPHWTGWGTRLTDAGVLLSVVGAGAAARICWLLSGLWRIRKYRIAATPLYPIPESVRAASAIAHADALLCISTEISGPVMLGWLAPVVLLPESFLGLGEEAQCAIACHEILHVRRADWVVTLLEELVGALLWFNPAAWILLAQARLAREELVDSETVRLTSAREPYIEALLAIARGRQTLDLAPAPLFLKRRHLTHRLHSLLKDVSVSKARVLVSYGFSSAILACAGWAACISFPLTGKPRLIAAIPDSSQPRIAVQPAAAKPATSQSEAGPQATDPQTIVAFQVNQGRRALFDGRATTTGLSSAPIPPDPQEPVTGGAQIASGPGERAAALYLLERARQNGLTHRAGTPPYRLFAAFNAGGSAANVGSGQLTETWLSGQRWRWTATLGSYSVIRVPGAGTASGETFPGVVPMPIQVLRNAIFWAIRQVPSNAQIRTAGVQWNGKAATCVLISGIVAPIDQTRLWEEDEYCIDNATGALQILSMAPGVYTVYGYSQNLQFHGRATPDRISVYANRALVLDAQVSLTDAGAIDEGELAPTPEMIAAGPVAGMELWGRFPMNVPSAAVSGMPKPVMIHASVSARGEVVEEELLAASDPALAQPALDVVKSAKFQPGGGQRQMYINVKFIPVQ